MTKEYFEFIPILIGIYITLLSTYWLLKKLPVWLNKPKRLLDRKKRRLVKKLLYYLEETNLWDECKCMGLCSFIMHLKLYNLISSKTHIELLLLLHDYHPMEIFPLEHNNSYRAYWFPMGDKQPRIDYLKRLLNE